MGGGPASHPVTAPPDPRAPDRPWLSSYPPGVPPSYAYPSVPLTRFIDDAARDFPDAVATRFHGAEISYAELADLTDRLAGALAASGVGRGTAVAFRLAPSPALPVTVFAILRLGAVAVPVPSDVEGEALVRLLDGAGCETAVVDATALDLLNEVRDDVERLDRVIATGAEEWLPFLRARLLPVTGRRGGSYRRITSSDAADRLSDVIDGADPIAEQGSFDPSHPALRTSTPEGDPVTLSHGQVLAAAFQARLWVPDVQAGKERVLVPEPLETAQRLVCGLFAPVLAAAALHLVRDPDPTEVASALQDGRATLWTASPELLRAVADVSDRVDLSPLRVGFVEGPLDAETVDRLEQRSGARIRTTYGRADAPIVLANPVYGRAARGELGLPVTDTVAIVVDGSDVPVPVGDAGQLLVSGPQVAGDARWTRTGLRAVMSERGSFRRVTEGQE